jgi:diguanylate cyclase (GGDEF)-like protein
MRKAIHHHVTGVAIALWQAAKNTVTRGIRLAARRPDIASRYDGRGTVIAALSQRLSGHSTALVIEIDDFRKIEDTFDRDSVGQMMIDIGGRIVPILQDGDVMARLEGPRFAIAASQGRKLTRDSANQLATRIQHAIAEPIALNQGHVHITASTGIAVASRMDNPSATQLLHAASVAQREASRAGPNAIRSYSAAMDDRINSHNGLRNEVQAALENKAITAFFQPQIDMSTGKITGFEALARWQHPRRGLIPPSDFLPLIEERGLMIRLGQRMLEDGLHALEKWDSNGTFIPSISINMSNSELRNPHLVDHIMMELDRFSLPPSRLVIEVLETVVVTRHDQTTEKNLTRLAALGCGIDLDDFGTGHASITSTRKFAIQRIKIDRSFITNVDHDTDQADMVSAILMMANKLGLATLAEGVETEQEQVHLTKMGCEFMQGFALARPASFDDTTRWIDTYQPISARHMDRHIMARKRTKNH